MRTCIALVVILVLVGCSRSENRHVRLEFRIVETEPAEGLTEVRLPGTGETFYLHDEVLLSNADIDTAYVTTFDGRPAVGVTMNEAGGRKFALLTRQNISKRMGILLDGKLVTAPVIRAQILQGRAVINGDFTREEAERIAETLVPE